MDTKGLHFLIEGADCVQEKLEEDWILGLYGPPIAIMEHLLSSSGPGPGPRSGPGQAAGQVQQVQGLRPKTWTWAIH